jgi:hypothetical protein
VARPWSQHHDCDMMCKCLYMCTRLNRFIQALTGYMYICILDTSTPVHTYQHFDTYAPDIPHHIYMHVDTSTLVETHIFCHVSRLNRSLATPHTTLVRRHREIPPGEASITLTLASISNATRDRAPSAASFPSPTIKSQIKITSCELCAF